MVDHNPDGWTFATLYQHIKEISAASKEAINAAMAAANVATDKAEKASEKRFDSVNEFREAMKDQQAHFADKEGTDRRLSTLEKAHASDRGKSQGIGLVALIITQGILILVGVAALFLKTH